MRLCLSQWAGYLRRIIYPYTCMTDAASPLENHDEATLDRALHALAAEVTADSTGMDAEAFRLHWLGRKQGRLKLISESWLKSAPPEARKPLGIRFNLLKQQIEAALETPAAVHASSNAVQGIDVTLPGTIRAPGIPHPLLKTMHEIVGVFHNLGYSTSTGPQVETDFYNFEALNFPPNHPARDTQDTLIIANQQGRPARGPPADAHPHQPGPDPYHDCAGSAHPHRHPRQGPPQ